MVDSNELLNSNWRDNYDALSLKEKKQILDAILDPENEYEAKDYLSSSLRYFSEEWAVPLLKKALDREQKSLKKQGYTADSFYQGIINALIKIGTSEMVELALEGFDIFSSHAEWTDRSFGMYLAEWIREILPREDYALPVILEYAKRLKRSGEDMFLSIFVEAIGQKDFTEAIPFLIDILKEHSSSVFSARSTAASSLGDIGSPEVIPLLVKELNGNNADVQRACAYALGDLKAKEAVGDLLKQLHNKESEVVYGVLDALAEIAEPNAIRELMKYIDKIDNYLEKLECPGFDKNNIFKRIGKILGRTNSRDSLDIIYNFIEKNGDFEEIYLNAVKLIRERSEIPRLISLLKHSDWRIKSGAAESLGEMNAKEAVPVLMELSEGEKYRNAYCSALVKIGTEEALKHVIRLFKTNEDEEDSSVLYSFRHFKSKEYLPLVLKLWEKMDWRLNYLELLRAFEKNNITEAVPTIVKTYEEVKTENKWKDTQNYRKSHMLLEALGKLGDENTLPFLEEQLEKETARGTRQFLKEAIDSIKKRTMIESV